MNHCSTTPPGPGRDFFTQLRPYLAALLLLLAGPLAHAQAPAWQSALLAGGNSSYYSSMATDAAGNVYLGGQFTGSVTLGATTLYSIGSYDVFVTKWSPATQSFVWAVRAGGGDDDLFYTLALNGTSIYLTGYFGGATSYFGTTILTNTGSPRPVPTAFVAKLVDAGATATFAWAQRFGGAGSTYGFGVAASGTSVYVAGQFSGSAASFGPLTLTNTGTTTGYVAKLADTGPSATVAWVQKMGDAGTTEATSVAAQGTDVFVAGHFTGPSASFGALSLANAHPGTQEVFVAKLADTGRGSTFGWVQQAGSAGNDNATQVAVNGANVYVTGQFRGPMAAFGTTALSNTGPANSEDGFVAKLVDTGAAGYAWAVRLGGTGADYAYALAVRGAEVYVTGKFTGVASFGAHTLTRIGGADLFVAKLSDNGPTAAFAWAQQAGGPSAFNSGFNCGLAVALAGTTVYVGALMELPARFGTIVLPGISGNNAVLASLTDATLTATAGPRALPDVAVFPNPAHATATLQLPPVPGAAAATIAITDALGRVIRTATVPLPAAGLRHELDLAGLPAGLYAVRVAAGANSATHRLVVE